MGKQLDRRRRAELKVKVRAEVDRLVGLGMAPSERKLKVAFPRNSGYLLLTLRDELADAGLVDWESPYGDVEAVDNTLGFSGATPEEKAEVDVMAALIRAENMAAGRPAAGDAANRQVGRVYEHPRPSWRGRA